MRKSVTQPKALEIIKKRLANLTPEQYIAPPDVRGDDEVVIGIARKNIKCLYTLREELAEEMEALIQALDALEAVGELFKLSPLIVEAMASLEREGAEAETLLGVVDGMFVYEIQSESGNSDKSVAVLCSDWTIVGRDDDPNEEETQ